ncbi:MAG TPA: chaperone NapD [Azospirillum sp.]|nr:chaperone NapD [Azospirillum sp.]
MRLTRFIDREAAHPPTGHNICGVLVHAVPERLEAARRGLLALPGVEIHQEVADGRLVVTVEDADGVPASLTLSQFPAIEGVVSAALVYHHCETDDLSEEMPS